MAKELSCCQRESEAKKHEELARRGQPDIDVLHNETKLGMS